MRGRPGAFGGGGGSSSSSGALVGARGASDPSSSSSSWCTLNNALFACLTIVLGVYIVVLQVGPLSSSSSSATAAATRELDEFKAMYDALLSEKQVLERQLESVGVEPGVPLSRQAVAASSSSAASSSAAAAAASSSSSSSSSAVVVGGGGGDLDAHGTHAKVSGFHLDHRPYLRAADGGGADGPPYPRFHFMFSTDCHSGQSSTRTLESGKMDWQSWLQIHSLLSSQRPDSKITELRACRDKNHVPFHHTKLPKDRVELVITENADNYAFPGNGGKTTWFPPANKFVSIYEWVNGPHAPRDEDMVVWTDPDFIWIRPVDESMLDLPAGHTVAQCYKIGTRWLNEFGLKICGTERCKNLSAREIAAAGEMGPPYFIRGRDLKRIAPLYKQKTEEIAAYQDYKMEWYWEMKGWNTAVLTAGFTFTLVHHFMLTGHGHEEWMSYIPAYAIHYCAGDYNLGHSGFMFWKHNSRTHNYFTCSSEPVEMPPTFVTGKVNVKRAFIGIYIVLKINEALVHFKELYCSKPADKQLETTVLRTRHGALQSRMDAEMKYGYDMAARSCVEMIGNFTSTPGDAKLAPYCDKAVRTIINRGDWDGHAKRE